MKQEEDPFDSIWDMKNELKFEYISAKPVVSYQMLSYGYN